MWQAVVLIPKGKEDYRGIGLVEVMWNIVAEILNLRLTASITFHDFLHGFLEGRGTGTATLKAKLLQQLAALREEVLYMIFLDLHKAYNALDRSRCLDILERYGVTPPIQADPTDILEAPHDGGEIQGILKDCIQGKTRGDTGISAFPHHL